MGLLTVLGSLLAAAHLRLLPLQYQLLFVLRECSKKSPKEPSNVAERYSPGVQVLGSLSVWERAYKESLLDPAGPKPGWHRSPWGKHHGPTLSILNSNLKE